MQCSLKQQQQRRRRVGFVAIATAASCQLLLPQTAANRDPSLAFAGTNEQRQMVGLLGLALTTILFVAAVAIRRKNRNKRVCEKLVSKWRSLVKEGTEGTVDRKEFEAGVKKIFTGHNEIGETETSYLYGLIQRLDTIDEKGPIDENELQTGLKKVMSLIGSRNVETVDDMREVLNKLASAASYEESDAIEAEVKKEMSSKSMIDVDENASDHRGGSAHEVESQDRAALEEAKVGGDESEGAALEETKLGGDEGANHDVSHEVEAC